MSFQTNTIYCGDNLDVLSRFPENSVDLIYADPPFFTEQPYEILWKNGYERRQFEDRWAGGIENYVKWMEPRLHDCHRVLKNTGSMYLHCDWHAGHRLQVAMDKIFHGHLINDIIWKRTAAHSGEGQTKKFGTIHDNILFYSKTDDYTFNPEYKPYSEAYLTDFFKNVDPDGRRWLSRDLTAAGIRHGESGKPWHGIDVTAKGTHWKFQISRLDELVKEGRIYFPKKRGGVPRYKQYLDESKGVLLQDIWIDINPIQAHAKERQGYPTQKPLALLERIVKASSNPTDIILDPFCGCGTTLIAAQKLGRRWIGIDVSPTACKLMRKRLRAEFRIDAEIIGMPKNVSELRALQPFEFQNWVFERLHGRVNPKKIADMGIDGYVELDVPVQVKQSEGVGRPVVDSFETALRRVGKKRGVIVAFSFGSGAVEEVARVKNNEDLEIRLMTVEEILKAS